MIRLYNTPDRKVVNFEPIISGEVKIYTCGPTVYDFQTIGNYTGYIYWDILVRLFKAEDYQIHRLMNITDVGHLVSDADEGEDKMQKGARAAGKSAHEIAKKFTDDFMHSIEQLNLLTPKYVIATEHIEAQIKLIKDLEAKGYTYKIDDGIYFDTSKFPQYADFAHLNLAGQEDGARINSNPQKRQPADFALWKFSPKDEKRDMEWDSPWGKGFPGWHIECSAMAMHYLGETIDIHTGGVDHIPTHHTNEIAQSEAATGKKFANYWLHNAHLMVDGQKISKSLGNGFTLKDLAAKGFSPMDFKMFVLQSHYRTQSNFTWDNLQAAQVRLKELQAWADLVHQSQQELGAGKVGELKEQLHQTLSDDLNTPQALAILSEFIGHGAPTPGLLKGLDILFGFNLAGRKDITDEQKQLIHKRGAAKKTKNFAAADLIRDQLEEQGIGINDTDNGPVWCRL